MSTQLQQAREALAGNNPQLAQALVAAVLQDDPQNGEAWFLLSEATEGERKLIFLKKANKLDPDNSEIQARLDELTGVTRQVEPAPEPEPEPVWDEPEDDAWDDFDMSALAEAEDDGEPIDTSAILVDEPTPAPKPQVVAPVAEPEPEPTVETAVAQTKAMATPTKAKDTAVDKEETKAGLDVNFIGMFGFGLLAVLFLLMAIWLAMGNF